MIRQVISGGQTGVDRAGLDAALDVGIPIGGYCPKGRLAEDGTIPDKYPLTEMESPESHYRTEKNVIASDGTLIFNHGELTQGTRLTRDFAIKYGKPHLVIQLDAAEVISPEQVVRWLKGQLISVLNIAGPRESKCPGIHAKAYDFLTTAFNLLKENCYG